MSQVSVIVPTLDEERHIERTLRSIRERADEATLEVVVADGGSRDRTVALAQRYARVVHCPGGGRGRQLNQAVRVTNGDILFFVHADMEVPPGAIAQVRQCIEGDGFDGGGFSNRFAQHNRRIKWLGRVLNLRVRDNEHPENRMFFGDNGIFVRRQVFENLGGFPEIPIMEDYEFSRRLARTYRSVRILNPKLIVSPRRHEATGFIQTRMQWILIKRLFQLGVSPLLLSKLYRPIR